MSRTFSKKQIKALLDIISKDTTRPALCTLAFKDSALVATDGYVLVAMDLTGDWKKQYNDDEDGWGSHLVPRESLEKWCKEHGAKDTINVEELFAMATKTMPYPEWRKIANVLPDRETIVKGIVPKPLFDMKIIAKVAKVFQDEDMWFETFGKMTALKMTDRSHLDVALVMPKTY